uniref:YqaJ viral recombinase domain-containing protein n=1 Tax=Panagrolaimus sp. PS1159 TaxID=55785 RepID=A0AC35G569_9BILA
MSSSWTTIHPKNRNRRRPQKDLKQNEQQLNINKGANGSTDQRSENGIEYKEADQSLAATKSLPAPKKQISNGDKGQASSTKFQNIEGNNGAKNIVNKSDDTAKQNLADKDMDIKKSVDYPKATTKEANEWTKIVKKEKKELKPKIREVIHYISLPNEEKIDATQVLKNIAGTIFQPEVVGALPDLLAGNELTLPLNEIGIVQNNIEYTTAMPILEEHHEILSFLWDNIYSGNVISGGRTNRALSLNRNETEYTLQKKTINGKEIYIINHKRSGPQAKLNDLQCKVYATITKDIYEVAHSTYSYGTKEISGCLVHFTAEEDVNEKEEFYEVKTLHEKKYPDHNLPPKIAYPCAVQCMHRKSKKLLVGFYNDTHVTLKLYTYQKLVEIAEQGKPPFNLNIAEAMFNRNFKQIIDFIKKDGDRITNKTVVIRKSITDTKKLTFVVQK